MSHYVYFVQLRLRRLIALLLAATFSASIIGAVFTPAFAKAYDVINLNMPRITFTFDDGFTSAYTQAAPTLAKYGLSGVDYVPTYCVGMMTAPNTCNADTSATYMTWTQIQSLQNKYGWEIGSHTVHHQCLASSAAQDPDDCQAYTMTKEQVDQELAGSRDALAAHGIVATDIATPFGDYNNSVLAEIAKYYESHRGFADQNANNYPYNEYLINDYPVLERLTPVSTVKAKIDSAIANKQWLVLTFHDIKTKPSRKAYDYQYGTAELDQIAAYVKAKQDAGLIQAVHTSQGLVRSSTNLLANGSFNDGIADGWATPNSVNVTADAGTNGSFPDPTNAIKFNTGATSAAAHLYSPRVAVRSNTTYVLKNFLNVQALTSGEVDFYIDEYDINGNWVSGQFKAAERSSFVENINFMYTPSSASVASASLQITAAGTGITAYVDNSQWFPAFDTAPVAQTNLMVNGAFDHGIADGWHTDSQTTITADSLNNGSPSNPVNAVKAISSSTNAHLFSPLIGVTAGHQYSLATYVKMNAITSGEVGFYIDEYDANGNWVSGQYKTGMRTVGAGDVAFSYTPTSTNVAQASLQIIVVANSGVQAYVDDVRWCL